MSRRVPRQGCSWQPCSGLWRLESPRWVIAATYSAAFDGSPFAGFELGVLAFTDPIFCFGGCER